MLTSRIISAALFCLLWGQANNASGAGNDDFVADELVCQVFESFYIDTVNVLYGTTTIELLAETGTYLLAIPGGLDAESLATVIETDPFVLACQPNYILKAPEPVQASSPFLDEYNDGDVIGQPARATLKLAQTQQISTGTDVKVGIVDVGINLAHPILQTKATSGFDYVASDPVANDEPGGIASGHGTFVAGVVNMVAPDAQLVAYRVLDTAGSGNGFGVAKAIVQAVQDGCKIINLSMVMYAKHAATDFAIEFARNNGVLVVAAAGNDSTDTDRFPANDSYTLAVAALDSLNFKADFSNFGGKVDICAPGTHVIAPYLDTMYARWDGTSFAAPFVAGQAAILMSANPTATLDEIIEAITLNAIPVDDINPAYVGMLGAGLIDPMASLAAMGNFVCGDVSGDLQGPDIADLTALVAFMFRNGPEPPIMAAADLNGSGGPIDIADLTYLVTFMFRGGPSPACSL